MKNKAIKIGILFSILFLLFCLIPTDVQAQCPMCRMSAESNLKNGGTDGRGLNTGILYMLVMPYILVGSIGFWWWRNRKKNEHSIDESGLSNLLENESSRYN